MCACVILRFYIEIVQINFRYWAYKAVTSLSYAVILSVMLRLSYGHSIPTLSICVMIEISMKIIFTIDEKK